MAADCDITLTLVALVMCLMTSSWSQPLSPRIVDTQHGKLRGLLLTLPARTGAGGQQAPRVEAYLGLQYASVLGGELRFMPPTSPLDKWTAIRSASKLPPVCPQRLPDIREMEKRTPLARVDHFRRLLPFLQHQSEECLNLNVYVPYRGAFVRSRSLA